MMNLKKLLLVAAFVIGAPVAAHAQNVGNARVVQTCASQSYSAGTNAPLTQDGTGAECVNATVTTTASVTGFTPNGNAANLAVTTSSGSVALPAGATIAVTNSGANDASIKLSIGAGSAATTDFVLKAGATTGLTPGSNTFINAITASGATTLSVAGGSGLVAGYGGGSSSGSGGNVTVTGPLGSAVSASSVSVVVASDQAAVAVKQATAANLNATVVGTGTFATQLTGATNNINNVAGTVSLPTGASTAAKQPALGTAGTASADVITVQGIASMTALKTDGSGVTQPVSGTVTANAGTNLNTSALATSANQTNASQKTQIVDGSGNVIAATSNALNVAVVSGGGTGGTSSNFGSAFPTPGTAVGFKDSTGTNMAAGNLDASGFLKVNVAAGGGSGGTSSTVGAAVPGTATAIGCRTLSSAPTDTTAQMNIPRCNTDGSVSVTGVGVTATTATSTVTFSPTSYNAATACNAKSYTNAQQQPADIDLKGNQCSNLASLAGTAVDTNSGSKSAGTLRVVIATDQPQLTNKLLVTPDSVALPANQSVNVSQINAVTPLMGNGTTGTGSQRVTLASDNSAVALWGQGATGSAVPANAVYAGVQNSAGLAGQIGCNNSVVYDASTSGSTELVALSGSTVVYVCGYTILAAGTVNVELDYGSGTACATGTTKLTPAFQLTTQTGAVDGASIWRGMKGAAAKALCIKASGGVAVQAVVYYTQF